MKSHNVSKVGSRDTKPEIIVRKIIHSMGLRFRLHNREIFGCPDIVLKKLKIAIFVHGCFWHRHECKYGTVVPKTNTQFWSNKFERNVKRDARVVDQLRDDGWRVLVYWECETKKIESLREKISTDFSSQ